jgi:hypothetical protein
MDDGLPISAYRNVRLVLGVIGGFDDNHTAMPLEAAPGARVLVRDGQMEVRAVGPIVERGTPGFYWGAGLHSTDVVTKWSEVSEELCAAGPAQEKRGWVLLTDSLGINSATVVTGLCAYDPRRRISGGSRNLSWCAYRLWRECVGHESVFRQSLVDAWLATPQWIRSLRMELRIPVLPGQRRPIRLERATGFPPLSQSTPSTQSFPPKSV